MEVEIGISTSPLNGLTVHSYSKAGDDDNHENDNSLEEITSRLSSKDTEIPISDHNSESRSTDEVSFTVQKASVNHMENGSLTSDGNPTEVQKPKRPPPPSSSELGRLKQLVTELEGSNQVLEEQLKAAKLAAQQELRLRENSESERLKLETGRQKLLNETSQLKLNVTAQQNEIKLWRERIDANDKAARKAIEKRTAEFQTNLDQVTSRLTECQAEKESMVVKFALGETKIATLNSSVAHLETRLRERDREKSLLNDKIKGLKSENIQAVAASQANKNAEEIQTLQREGERLKEELSTLTVRTKWAQNKLTAEKNAHKETKSNLDQTQRKLKESKEECEQVRVNCQRMIETYQKSEEIASSKLGVKLEQKSAEFNKQAAAVSSLSQKLSDSERKVDKLSAELQIITKQRSAADDKISELEESLNSTNERLAEEQQLVSCLRGENSDVRVKLSELSTLTKELEEARNEVEELSGHMEAQEAAWRERDADMDSLRKREADSLQLTQRMTMRNAELQSACSKLKAQIEDLERTVISLEERNDTERELVIRERQKCSAVESSLRDEIGRLSTQLSDAMRRYEQLHTDHQEALTDINALKKKQTSSLKELKREVHTLRRQLEAYESKHTEDSSSRSPNTSHAHSRTNSVNSLDRLETKNPEARDVSSHPGPTDPPREYRGRSADLHEMAPPPMTVDIPEDSLEPSFLEPDKQKLIEKIVLLQRKNARKNEKIDFCEDQIKSLIEEVQKKNRIIQHYALREEVGALSNDSMDLHRSKMAKKRGIMASISNQHSLDGSMNLELSLQINHRLQAVLEDTLLKNITLKENMETLGHEIARMAAENADLKHRLNTPS